MSEHHDDRPPLEAGKPAARSDRADISKGDFSHGVHMETYVKLFGSIIHSTVWQADLHVKVVWITLLAMADEDGNVWSSIPGLAKAAGVSIEQCTEALRNFMAPDAYSRTKDHEGRRLAEIDGGWLVLNYTMYRRLASSQDKKNAEKQRRYRDRKASRYVTLPHVTTEGEEEVKGEVQERKPLLSEAIRLADLLEELIRVRKSDFFRRGNWVHDLDLLLRVDQRTPERAEAVIRWCQADSFWAANILSGAKLREKFDQLELRMSSEGGASGQQQGYFPTLHQCEICNKQRAEEDMKRHPSAVFKWICKEHQL